MSTLRRSNLLSPEQVAVAAEIATRFDAVGVAKELILREWLTEWQARQLLAGKSKLFLGRYKLMDVLGQGGMGAVLKAESTTLRRLVALKVMASNLNDDDIARARFEREIAFSASLNHPNIVRAIDADQIGDRVFLVMEYFEGRDLKAVAKEQGQVSIEFACECIRQAALGLQHAFEQGIVHRDIKPSNLLVTKDPKTNGPVIKVLDLGLARASDQAELSTAGGNDFGQTDGDVTRSGQIMGSPDYMSPEQAISSSKVDIRSDIYGLGVTLFQLLCNELPYQGENVMEKLLERINKDAPPVSTFRPEIPPVLVHIVSRMLHRDPAQRFQTPAEVAAVLQTFVTDPESLEIQPEPASEPVVDLPPLDSQADETLNLFMADLDSQAAAAPGAVVTSGPVVTSRPVVVHRRKKSVWPLAITIGIAMALIVAVLFVISQGLSAPEKKSSDKPAKKKGTGEPNSKVVDRGSGGGEDDRDDSKGSEHSASEVVTSPPGNEFSGPEGALVEWARRAAQAIRIETSSGESVVKSAEPLPRTSYSLIGIDLSGVQVLNAEALQMVVSGKSIRYLDLSGGRLRDFQLRQVARMKELRHLDIGNTTVTDEGLDVLGKCRKLTTLRLRYDSIGDAGVSSLTELESLSDLDLEGTDVTDAVVETLASFSGLQKLNLKYTAVSEKAVEQLQSSLPDCTIDY